MSRFRQQFIQVEKDKSRENEVEKYVKGLFWILLIAENWKFIIENTVAK